MPNDVFRAIDATLVFGVEDAGSPEGTIADSIVSEYDLSNVVGRLRNIMVSIHSDVQPFYEIGRRYPTHLRPGQILVTGTVERAHVNGALLRLLLGDGAVSPPGSANFEQPVFNIICNLRDPARPDQHTKVIIFGVKFENWTYNVPSENFVMEAVTFKALRLAFEEA